MTTPTQMTAPIIPALRYRGARKAIAWLQDAFGFQTGLVVAGEGDYVEHAELFYGSSALMLGSERENDFPLSTGDSSQPTTMSLYMIVDDPDAHYARAKAAGAEIVREIEDTDYGSREYSARDTEGHLWSFGSYSPTSPDNA